MYLYSGLIHVYSSGDADFDVEEIETDSGQEHLNSEIQSLLKKFYEFKEVGCVADCEWPASIPAPAHSRPTEDNEQTAVYDLVGKLWFMSFFMSSSIYSSVAIQTIALGP